MKKIKILLIIVVLFIVSSTIVLAKSGTTTTDSVNLRNKPQPRDLATGAGSLEGHADSGNDVVVVAIGATAGAQAHAAGRHRVRQRRLDPEIEGRRGDDLDDPPWHDFS